MKRNTFKSTNNKASRLFLLIGSVVLVFIFIFFAIFLGVAGKYGNNQHHKGEVAQNYLFGGRGACDSMANISDEDLSHYIENNILNNFSKKWFLSELLEKKDFYETKNSDYDKKCLLVVNRSIEALKSIDSRGCTFSCRASHFLEAIKKSFKGRKFGGSHSPECRALDGGMESCSHMINSD